MHDPVAQPGRPARRRPSAPIILLAILILGYAVFFSAYTVQRHNTLGTIAADLSSTDQAMWNTLHGRLLERTLGAAQISRLAEHFEPILIPLSLVYLVWNDVAAMLIVQAFALALGGLPVFWIARRTFADHGRRAKWLALAFSLAYLLFPALQAANVAGFRANPLAVTPFLFAFWYGTERRWRLMWPWAILVVACGENLALLTAMLGLLFVVSDPGFRAAWQSGGPRRSFGTRIRSAFAGSAKHGLALFMLSAAWYVVAAFVIVAPLVRQYARSGLAEVSALPTGGGLTGALALLQAPAGRRFLVSLFGSVGWLALLAPEYLLMGVPLLIANASSASPGQFSSEPSSFAALVPVFIIATIYGARRLQGLIERQIPFRLTPLAANAAIVAALAAAWLVFWSGSAQVDRGWTPLARPFDWPAYTSHDAALARLAGQIHAGAAVSATTAAHPDLAHREKVYIFPELGDAEYVLVDVAGSQDIPAGELKSTVERLVNDRAYGVVDAADGYLLLARGTDATAIPADFYTFAQAKSAQPDVPIQARFGSALQFLGYDVIDDMRSRLTRFRLYFKRPLAEPLPADLAIRYTSRDQAGAIVDDSEVRPSAAALWYPPSAWAQGETVMLETPAAYLPGAFAPVVTVTSGGHPVRAEVTQGPPTTLAPQGSPSPTVEVAPDGSLRLPGLARRAGRLGLYEGPLYAIDTTDATFAGDDWSVRLREFSAPLSVAPGGQMPVLLYWQAARAAPQDYTVVLHLRDATGKTVAGAEGQPTWYTPRPASTWPVADDGLAGVIDAHAVQIPIGVEPGRYELVVGWQDSQTGKRLSRVEGSLRNPVGDEFVLGAVTVDPLAGPRPDACCLAAKECCVSSE